MTLAVTIGLLHYYMKARDVADNSLPNFKVLTQF